MIISLAFGWLRYSFVSLFKLVLIRAIIRSHCTIATAHNANTHTKQAKANNQYTKEPYIDILTWIFTKLKALYLYIISAQYNSITSQKRHLVYETRILKTVKNLLHPLLDITNTVLISLNLKLEVIRLIWWNFEFISLPFQFDNQSAVELKSWQKPLSISTVQMLLLSQGTFRGRQLLCKLLSKQLAWNLQKESIGQ